MWHLNHTPRRLFFFFHVRFLLHGSKNSYLHIYCSGRGITLMGIWFYCSSIELPLARGAGGRSNRMEPTLIYFGEPRWMLKYERFLHFPSRGPRWNIIRGSSVRQGCFKQIVNSISSFSSSSRLITFKFIYDKFFFTRFKNYRIYIYSVITNMC